VAGQRVLTEPMLAALIERAENESNLQRL